jgi:DNA modification methylase
MMELYKGDCLEVMKNIESGSVDAIITDPPYGTTACKWDSVIDFDLMWEQLNRIIKPNGAIVLFGSEPFSSALRMSNIKNYKYDWIWKKNRPQGFMNAKKQPLKDNEIISVFYKKQCAYNPQGLIEVNKLKSNTGTKNNTGSKENGDKTSANNSIKNKQYIQNYGNYPNRIIEFKNTGNKQKHPTQKPVALMEYLIKTYTNENEAVLDFTMGSGTTGVACKKTNRNFIGIEQDDKYFEIAKNRIENAVFQIELF